MGMSRVLNNVNSMKHCCDRHDFNKVFHVFGCSSSALSNMTTLDIQPLPALQFAAAFLQMQPWNVQVTSTGLYQHGQYYAATFEMIGGRISFGGHVTLVNGVIPTMSYHVKRQQAKEEALARAVEDAFHELTSDAPNCLIDCKEVPRGQSLPRIIIAVRVDSRFSRLLWSCRQRTCSTHGVVARDFRRSEFHLSIDWTSRAVRPSLDDFHSDEEEDEVQPAP